MCTIEEVGFSRGLNWLREEMLSGFAPFVPQGCFNQGETIKAGRIMLGWTKTCLKIRRRAGGSVDVSTEDFGPWIRASGQEERILH
ncbi:unnamed protein product [Musa acuminata subsp. burmannicoides]